MYFFIAIFKIDFYLNYKLSYSPYSKKNITGQNVVVPEKLQKNDTLYSHLFNAFI